MISPSHRYQRYSKTDAKGKKVNQDEAAIYLGFRPKTLEIWRQRGKGPKFTKLPNGKIKYAQADLDDYHTENIQAWIKAQKRYPMGRKSGCTS